MSDVDTFLSTYNHDNMYNGLSLGNYVTIQDGTYNVQWVIAGFDMEHNQTAADGTVYDNGYGICLIPKDKVCSSSWSGSYGDYTNGAYSRSIMHTTTLPGIVSNLKNILGSHIINRNVLLSNDTDSVDNHSSSYVWTTSDATCMSVGQLTGTFASNWTKYDDGEANYKLPIFDTESFCNGTRYWTRNIWNIRESPLTYHVMVVATSTSVYGGFQYTTAADSDHIGVRPLIYIR